MVQYKANKAMEEEGVEEVVAADDAEDNVDDVKVEVEDE